MLKLLTDVEGEYLQQALKTAIEIKDVAVWKNEGTEDAESTESTLSLSELREQYVFLRYGMSDIPKGNVTLSIRKKDKDYDVFVCIDGKKYINPEGVNQYILDSYL